MPRRSGALLGEWLKAALLLGEDPLRAHCVFSRRLAITSDVSRDPHLHALPRRTECLVASTVPRKLVIRRPLRAVP
jgi:hypothetical protein